MGKAWQVPVLVDSPNIHPCFICAKSQLICGKKYLEGKIKIVTFDSTWYLFSEICTVYESHMKSEPGRLSAKARKAKHINSLFKMQSLQEYWPWPNGLASRHKLKNWVYLRLRLVRPCVHLRWLAMTCAHFGRDQICTQVKASFSTFGHPTQVNVSWVTSINLLLASEIEDSLA